MCLDTYLYLHCVSRKRYQNLVQHYQQHGLCPRIHGNTKRLPANCLPKDDIEYLTKFITNYARAHGMPLPGRVTGHRDKVMVLPTDITKLVVYPFRFEFVVILRTFDIYYSERNIELI